jgi:glycerol dehydrogenase
MSRMLLSPGRYVQGAAAIREVQDFCFSVGLPLCLEDLDIADPAPEDISQVAAAAVAEGETIHSTWFPVSAAMAEAAIQTADALGTRFIQVRQR